ncbi:putative S-adenosylmethionine-dependent methyltransferase At5g38100 [Morella rubra]|uniref:Putative S-adenosylmethionine-dependent methyltransferase At5g38100 n=1 Tax=Morella rubra TaxID=262757 RepID=A0A6A1V3T0_9ROSI|nr:putative S-adenosylmethionine-dependent methyltransferase At5g38100 [Morella rubra]
MDLCGWEDNWNVQRGVPTLAEITATHLWTGFNRADSNSCSPRSSDKDTCQSCTDCPGRSYGSSYKCCKNSDRRSIVEKLDLEEICSASECVFRVTDMGYSVGPNTFIAMQDIINAVKYKYQSQGLTSHIPEFLVFLKDHASNDFNTLFTSLPPERPYFAAGVPRSFYGRLCPESSLHFLHSSYALQFLSEVLADLLNKNSPAWNKGRIHYIGAPDDVARAYTTQFLRTCQPF